MTFHQQLQKQVVESLSVALPSIRSLNQALRLLSKWRSVLIQNTFIQHHGTVVLEGPLEGLDFLSNSAEGCHIPKLMGCYEQPLLPFIEQAVGAKYQTILNIGCAEGYYAVGMARRMPETRVLAFDRNPAARKSCSELAAKNGVDRRVLIGENFRPDDFETHAGRHALVLCDIEGGERQLLDPALAPALRQFDLIVESHDCLSAGTTKLLVDRFTHTHTLTVVEDDGQRRLQNPPAWFKGLAHLDQLLAFWEWRSGPTPWIVMKAKKTKTP